MRHSSAEFIFCTVFSFSFFSPPVISLDKQVVNLFIVFVFKVVCFFLSFFFKGVAHGVNFHVRTQTGW